MVKFPQELDDNESLFLAVNNTRTLLSSALTDSATTATVLDTTGFPPTGYVSILTGEDILDTEAITYSGTTSTQFLNLVRGADGTAAVVHSIGDEVDLTIVAQHHNELKDAIIVLEDYVGVIGDENFVPQDAQGNVLISGTLSVCDDSVFKTDVIVSGCLQVGQLFSSTPTATYEFEDDVFTTTLFTTYEDTGVSIVPDNGVNLLLYRANSSAVNSTSNTALRALYAGAAVNESEGSPEEAVGDHWNATQFTGFKVVTANGVDTLRLQAKATGGSPRQAAVGSQQVISVPLETLGLVENTDYWFDNGSESSFNIPASSGTNIVTVNSFDITVPVTGPYLLLGNAEARMIADSPGAGQYAVYSYANESNISSNMVRDGQVGGPGALWHTNPWAQVINLNAGANNISIRARRWNGTFGMDLRRATLCLINGSSFDNMTGAVTFTDTDTSSSTFTEITQISQTHAPTEPGQVLVFGSSNSRSFDVTGPEAIPTFKIRDDTDGVDYAEDFGEGMTRITGGITTIHSQGFAIKDDALNPTDWKMFVRDANATGNQVRSSKSSLVVWSLIPPSASETLLTTLKTDKILTPNLCADEITIINSGTLTVDTDGEIITPILSVSDSLTISGVAVATGTGGGASTLQEAYDSGDGIISSTVGKPLELSGTGELLAITGTFTEGLTVGTASTLLNNTSITTGSGIFTDLLTFGGDPVATAVEVVAISGHLQTEIDSIDNSVTLQEAFDNGDGTISTTGGKPVELTGTGELVAVTGTFTDGLTSNGPIFSNDIISIPTGSAGAPSISFAGDSGTGIFSFGAGLISFAIDGSFKANLSSTGFLVLVQLTLNVGSESVPAFGFFSDEDTGMYRPTANEYGFVTGGTEGMRLDSNQFLGIGTKTPTERLHVVGSGIIDGDLEVIGTTINLSNLPTSSGALNAGDLWVDTSADYTVKVTPG